LKITHCVFNFENHKLNSVSLDSTSHYYGINIQLNKLTSILSKETSKFNIESEIFKFSFLTNGFELEDGFWFFANIKRYELSGRLF
jgi:hypothetical protein